MEEEEVPAVTAEANRLAAVAKLLARTVSAEAIPAVVVASPVADWERSIPQARPRTEGSLRRVELLLFPPFCVSPSTRNSSTI